MSDPVARLNAALHGRYRIERELGEGGMATVYLAEDLRHKRNVALKVLKPELAAVVGAERFLAEIETTAGLQHPHILPLFDSGEADGFLFYVMPYVDGETLRERLDREKQLPVEVDGETLRERLDREKQLPVEEAVRIATDLAEALDYAHRQNVIHRDIKPANVLMQDGQPVISDFGIALAVGVAGGGRLTETGLSLGTPHYMSPEQATGDQTVARATDIYALGAVLYEMLVGEPPYTGSTAQAVLGRIIAGEPASARQERPSVPSHVDAAVRRALEKLPADRFAGAVDFAGALADPGFRYGEDAVAPDTGRRPSWQMAGALGVGVLLGVAAALVVVQGRLAPPTAELMRFEIVPPDDAQLASVAPRTVAAISPDGRHIVYDGPSPAGEPQLYLRSIDELAAVPLRGGERGWGPFFSPDGAWVGFADANHRALHKIPVLGGPPVRLAESPAGSGIFGASWGADDQIVYGTDGGGLFRVSGAGGTSEGLTTPDEARGERRHLFPSWISPDAVVFMVHGDGEFAVGKLAVLDLGSREVARLGIVGRSPRYLSTGHLLYVDEVGSLRAVPFDDDRLEVSGNSVVLVEDVSVNPTLSANFSVTDTGHLIYVPGTVSDVLGAPQYELVWVDREGREEALPLAPQSYFYTRVSPDGGRIALSIQRGEYRDLWVYDVASGAGLRLTRDDTFNNNPMWTPDGQRIFFSSTKDAPRPAGHEGTWWGNVYVIPANGSGEPTRVTTGDESQALTGIAPDGATLAYTRVTLEDWEIVGLPADGSDGPRPLVSGPFREGSGVISPNGRWLAYRSDETGSFEIYVQAFPGVGAKVPVSIGGGNEPMWSRDSRELFYTDGAGTMMAASMADEDTPRVVEGTALFSWSGYRTAGAGSFARQYHVAPDGRFLMMKISTGNTPGQDEAMDPRITVVLNWFDELRSRVPN